MSEQIKFEFEGKMYEFPIVIGSEGEKAIDISNLRKKTGLITLDPGFVNTGSCESQSHLWMGKKGFCVTEAFLLKNLPSIRLFCRDGLPSHER